MRTISSLYHHYKIEACPSHLWYLLVTLHVSSCEVHYETARDFYEPINTSVYFETSYKLDTSTLHSNKSVLKQENVGEEF